MPPIPVYANAPLHAEGVTPKTTSQEVEPQPEPTRTTATTTAPSYQPLVPPPQAGARPAAPTDTTPSFCDPPGPRPGTVPHEPRPHQVTETHVTTTTAWQQPSQPTHQFFVATPARNYAPTHSINAGIPQPSLFEAGRADLSRETDRSTGDRRSLEHPPGYVQNPYAADGTAQDRARFEHAQREASEEEGVMGTVKSYLGGAGSALKKAEESAWGFAKGLGK